MLEIREALNSEKEALSANVPHPYEITSVQLVKNVAQTEHVILVLESNLQELLSRKAGATVGGSFSASLHPVDLLKIAKHILQVLDPSPQDKILETLNRIEKALAQNTNQE